MKYALFFISSFLSLTSIAYADSAFPASLEARWIDVNAIYNAPTVPRGTVAELLNIVDCHDCHRPSTDVVNSLTQSWWNAFRQFPGKNFDDVKYDESLDVSNNYYCIAYVGNQWYMNGYPRSTSPFCSWKFCGWLPITNADLIQTIFNITSKAFYSDYKANRSIIASWLPQQSQSIQNYFDLQDLGIINTSKDACWWSWCAISSPQALQTYAKYCTFEPSQCGMKELPFAKRGERPIAEMNILGIAWIFTDPQIRSMNIENYASWDFVLDVLWRVKPLMQCQDTDDQDGDGIKDYEDNCYRTYNPTQRDTDSDRIGNVCDDDIDGDTIKNPIGAVDDNDNIVYMAFQQFSGRSDNCLFIVNTDQRDDDTNNVGNACDNNDPIGLRIEIKQLIQSRYVLVAQYSWVFKQFVWYYGDKTTGSWEITTHTYVRPWQYTVRVEWTSIKWQVATAYATLTVWGVRAILTPTQLIQWVWTKVLYTVQLQGIDTKDVDYIDIQRWDGRTRQLRGKEITSFIDAYNQQWSYAIYGSVYALDGKVAPLGAYVTVKWWNFCLPYNASSRAWHCDMNKDSIPDMCDTDIDGDGVSNPLWLIRFEKPNCTYDATNTNVSASGWVIWSLQSDNCPFVSNPDQKSCKALNDPDKDTDGDGIPDSKDQCPTIPETINGIDDADGCPEYDVLFSFPGTVLQAWSCQSCPCQYAQNDSTLAPWDRVKAVLYNSWTGKPVTESDWYTVQ
jgi:hypothetical protein